jgi:hypothetical protein
MTLLKAELNYGVSFDVTLIITNFKNMCMYIADAGTANERRNDRHNELTDRILKIRLRITSQSLNNVT